MQQPSFENRASLSSLQRYSTSSSSESQSSPRARFAVRSFSCPSISQIANHACLVRTRTPRLILRSPASYTRSQNPGVPQGIRIARIGVTLLLLFEKRLRFQGIHETAVIKCMLPHLDPETMQRYREVAPHLVGTENGGMKVRQPAPLQIRRDVEFLPAIQDVLDC